MLTVEIVRERVAEIAERAKNDEVSAHVAEDRLYKDVLAAIADGSLAGADAVAVAREALTARTLQFERWYE